ncbi:hypothetical protein NMH_2471 [Neisseria meningitidis H44/76]|uniref:Uncharacterized protein n=1 Tax=Neisseria meningitidis serogroup B / serotype 15 (strain H44/76) TaxID=909420 RepID=E6N0T6_NEIMH|nr:hypothetical protein NMH_2471 [Neisseria meningitidis H44/76]
MPSEAGFRFQTAPQNKHPIRTANHVITPMPAMRLRIHL